MKQNLNEPQWEQIVREAFAPDSPDPDFSPRYLAHKRALERMVTMKEQKKILHEPGLALMTAACLLVAAVPVGFVASVKYRPASLDPAQAVEDELPVLPPEETAEIMPVEETAPAEETAPFTPITQLQTYEYQLVIDPAYIAEEQPLYEGICAVTFDYLPEGMYYHTEGPYEGKIHRDDDDRYGITPQFCKIPDGMTATLIADFVTGAEELTSDTGNQVYWMHKDGAWDEVWVCFTGTPYFEHMFLSETISDDEIRAVFNGLRLLPAEEETAHIWTAGDDEKPTPIQHFDGTAQPGKYGSVDLAATELYHVGDTIRCYEPYGGYSVTVNDVRVQSDFAGLSTDGIGRTADFSKYLDADGHITAQRTETKVGNGVDTADEIRDTGTVRQYVVLLDLTYTNLDESYGEITLQNEVYAVKDGAICRPDWNFGTGCLVSYEPRISSEGMEISYITDDAHRGDKNGIIMNVGESVQVTEAYLVDEDWFGSLYLHPAQEYDGELPSKLLDLTDLRPE